MTIVSSASTPRWTNRESLHKDQDSSNKDSCRKGEWNSRFPVRVRQLTMMPVRVDTASASAVAAKNIFIASELGGGLAGYACAGFGISSFGPSTLAYQTLPNWVEKPFGKEGKAFPFYAIVRDAQRCWGAT